MKRRHSKKTVKPSKPHSELQGDENTSVECNQSHEKMKTMYSAKHPSRNKLMCEYCSSDFTTKTSLTKHIQKQHKMLENIEDSHQSFQCSLCNDPFDTAKSYLNHYQIVHADLPPDLNIDLPKIYCSFDQCGKMFTSQQGLKKHQAYVHENKYHVQAKRSRQEHKCTYCDKVYSNQFNCKEHIKAVHENNTPHQCSECPRKFAFNQSLKSHKLAVHSKKPCEKCDKIFNNNTEYRRHQSKEHGIVQAGILKCKFCSSVFKHEQLLKRHEESKHSHEFSFESEAGIQIVVS